jgi:hypothetical protein
MRRGLVRTEIDVHAGVQDLEKHLQLSLFGGRTADRKARCCWSAAPSPTATGPRRPPAEQTQRLAMITPGDPDMAAAADHARGLIEQDPKQ